MEILIRATVIYWFLWLLVRGTGKRSLAELTPLEMLVIVVLGDFVQQGVTQEDMSVTGAVLTVSIFVGWTVVSDAVGRRSRKVSNVLNGVPVVVIQAGVPVWDRLRTERLTFDELCEAARIHGFGDLGQIEWGILETDGQFSFVEKKS